MQYRNIYISLFVLILICITNVNSFANGDHWHTLYVEKMSSEEKLSATSNIHPRVIGANNTISGGGGKFKQTVYDRDWVETVGVETARDIIKEQKEIIESWETDMWEYQEENLQFLESNPELDTMLGYNSDMSENLTAAIETQLALPDNEFFLEASMFTTELITAEDSRLLTMMYVNLDEYFQRAAELNASMSEPNNLIKIQLSQQGGIQMAGVFNRNNAIEYLVEKNGIRAINSYPTYPGVEKALIRIGFIKSKTNVLKPCR